MDRADVKRALLNVGQDGTSVQVDIVTGGRVRLRLVAPGLSRDLFCDTLEELPLLALEEPALDGELYEQLMWELDLMGLRGDGGHVH